AVSCLIQQSVLNNFFQTTGSPKSKTHQHNSITHSRWSAVDGYALRKISPIHVTLLVGKTVRILGATSIVHMNIAPETAWNAI
ncbi:MAG: hypothetical protein PHF56_15720, partial [Desulfuromonadaceae bacterium]|nr:hypothetical protein [Desulfuromonadaceae bacterium]